MPFWLGDLWRLNHWPLVNLKTKPRWGIWFAFECFILSSYDIFGKNRGFSEVMLVIHEKKPGKWPLATGGHNFDHREFLQCKKDIAKKPQGVGNLRCSTPPPPRLVCWLVMDQAPFPLGTKVLFHQWPTTSGTLILFQGRPGRRWSGRYCPPTGVPGVPSVRKMVSRSKFAELIFTQQAEQNFQMCAQIVCLFRMTDQTPSNLPMFSTVRTVFTPSRVRAGRTSCLSAPVPVQMLFRLNLTD